MRPFEKEYIIKKIEEYNNIIKENKIGNYEIKKVNGLNGIIQGYMYSKEDTIENDILELNGENHQWMRLTPFEIEGTYFSIKRAKGKVGIAGLGLGYTAQEIAKKAIVKEVVVYELNKEIIDLYYKSFAENEKIKIIHGDAFEAESEEFDFFFSDLYMYKLTSDVVNDYDKFNKLHKIEEYSFFGMEHFLLSCSYDKIVWVFIPENWMEMARKAYNNLEESGYLKYYEQLPENIVDDVLDKFKDILNAWYDNK